MWSLEVKAYRVFQFSFFVCRRKFWLRGSLLVPCLRSEQQQSQGTRTRYTCIYHGAWVLGTGVLAVVVALVVSEVQVFVDLL